MPTYRHYRQYNVAYYARNREAELQRVRRRQNETLAFLRSIRRGPCKDCGGLFAPHQMDFDHRDPTEKSFQITTGRALLASRPRLLAEVAKCDIVCANCHRLRTRAQHRARLASTERTGRSRYIERQRARWRANAALLDQLRDVPCTDCGGRYPPCAMDFDHPDPAGKVEGVTRLISKGTHRMLAEVAKCDIVCANCHRSRTRRRREGFSERE
jgi:hypothetical protein